MKLLFAKASPEKERHKILVPDGLGRALYRLPIPLRTFVIKLSHKWLPVHTIKTSGTNHTQQNAHAATVKRKQLNISYSAITLKAQKARERLIQTVMSYCNKIKTAPKLCTLLLRSLKEPMNGSKFQKNDFPEQYHRLINQQKAIGWIQVYYGRLGTNWVEQQTLHSSQDGEKLKAIDEIFLKSRYRPDYNRRPINWRTG